MARIGAYGRRVAIGGALVLVASGSIGGDVARSAARGYPIARMSRSKLDSRLAEIAATARSSGRAAAVAAGRRSGIDAQAGRVRVIVVAKAGRSAQAQHAVEVAGGAVEESSSALSEALVPPSGLAAVAEDPSVARVRAPYVHEADAVDEGVQRADADTWHTAGYTGTGAKIAIIDVGFSGYGSLLGTALPASVTTVDDCHGNFSTADVHGTAVAEIVHQMAPSAQLTLICIDDEVGLANAEQYVVAHGIKIVNHSVSWFDTSRGDGTGAEGTPDAIVADARANGVLWVNAAGNYALDHWGGRFEPDASDVVFNDFEPGEPSDQFNVAAGGQACALLKWDGWPTTTDDYDLLVTSVSDGSTVATSANDQADQSGGPVPPVEEACFTNSSGSVATYAVWILRYSAPDIPPMDLFVVGDVSAITSTRARSC